MNSRIGASILFVILVMAVFGLWWTRPKTPVVAARKFTPNTAPAATPNEPAPAPTTRAVAPARPEPPPPPQFNLGTVDFGALNFKGDVSIKRFPQQSGLVVALSAKPNRDGSLTIEVGTVDATDPEDTNPFKSQPVTATAGAFSSSKLDSGETVKFTPQFSIDSTDRGITDLGEVDLRGGEQKSFRLKSSRTLTLHVELDMNGRPLLVSNAYEPGYAVGSNPFVAEMTPFEPGKPFIQELGDEAVKFTPLYEIPQ